ncbi:hypothetical protein, partial [Paraburkholderia sp. SIMBA_027]|uniref:hypothetical protein n=1 Tax=Paraburkholderia sp. SIMBA_027 TaxID=3085770 RepID=UPI0039783AF2
GVHLLLGSNGAADAADLDATERRRALTQRLLKRVGVQVSSRQDFSESQGRCDGCSVEENA